MNTLWTQNTFTINKTCWQQVTDFFLFTIILNTNATMMYNADLGGWKFRQIEAN